jgi:hypothetical protein
MRSLAAPVESRLPSIAAFCRVMNRLQTEFHRLYHPRPAEAPTDSGPDGLIDAQGRVRAMVLELARPADWEPLSTVWRGVQADLGLPAPAIAVSGTDGLQLWFSLGEPLGVPQAHAFLEALRCRYLPDVARQRVSLMPAPDAASASGGHAPRVPALQEATGNWSAFVAPDLAPVFAETPWLDLPPSEEGQANLLCKLASIRPPMLAAALEQLAPVADHSVASPLPADSDTRLVSTRPVVSTRYQDPRSFLLAVMNDEAVPLALRIEAAKALLPGAEGGPRSR